MSSLATGPAGSGFNWQAVGVPPDWSHHYSGLLLHVAGICPVVKRIRTLSWTLFSGGICSLMLAGFDRVIAAKRYRKWAFPLVVIGMNSIAAYLVTTSCQISLFLSLRTHFGANVFKIAGPALEPLMGGSSIAGILDGSVLDVPP